MKRTTRRMSEKTKQKISKKLAGRPKTETHKQRISTSLKRYWETLGPEQ